MILTQIDTDEEETQSRAQAMLDALLPFEIWQSRRPECSTFYFYFDNPRALYDWYKSGLEQLAGVCDADRVH